VLVLGVFAVPLLLNLQEPDLRNDEAIYSYAVDRILETGDWVTPRSIPSDWAFFEKPPLKFWIVAGGITSGWLPHSEIGLRFFDGLFGGLAFLYVYAFGRRLAGAICGIVAVLVLFTLDPLLFEHGLRSNNMEASVFLGYCGGLYHFYRWAEATGRARGHALAVGGYFFLAFMTKFVAAAFLPMVAVAALLLRPKPFERIRTAWTDWIVPVLLVVALGAPWFIYHARDSGAEFWQILIGEHVYKRFTASLDTAHLHPWHYYFTGTWREVVHAGTQIIVLAGLVRLTFAVVRGESWLSRVIWLWGMLPLAAISFGTSKLLHYAYPFWPPLGLAAGFAVATAVRALDGRPGQLAASKLAELVPARARNLVGTGAGPKRALVAIGMLSLSVAIYTFVIGPWHFEIGRLTLFRNSSVIRPLVIAALLLFLVGYSKTLVRLFGVLGLLVLLPIGSYVEKVQRTAVVDHPLRAVRDCMIDVRGSGAPIGDGVLGASGDILHHSYYYYFWRQGSWVIAPEFPRDEVVLRLSVPGQQTPVLMSREHYEPLYRDAASAAGIWEHPSPGADLDVGSKIAPYISDGVVVGENIAMMLPGPFKPCVTRALDAGAGQLWRVQPPERRP
jgi:4-amino-4-deoxy-L-arabinose transferase-like glycosyltransferase